MSQTSFKLEANKETALELQARFELLFEDEGFPVSCFENTSKPELWEIGLYVHRERAEEVGRLIDQIAQEAGAPGSFQREDLPDTDWVSKTLRDLAPVHAGRFIVHGSHDRNVPCSHHFAIEVDAGLAFGTGHHGTTAGCLQMLDRVLKQRSFYNALDLGTGSGVLAIAIAKSAHASVLATDIDPVSVSVAASNARLNGVQSHVECLTAAGFSHYRFAEQAPFDLVIANILARPLQNMAPDISNHTARGGTVILSGLLPHQRAPLVARFRLHGLHLQWSLIRDGWLSLVFSKP